MVKFIFKKRREEKRVDGKVVIYYNVSDVFLGIALVALVVFFINDYLSHNLTQYKQNGCEYSLNRYMPDGSKLDSPIRQPKSINEINR